MRLRVVTRPYRVKPIEQIQGTCWFYSIINMILHSKVLKRNIEFAIRHYRPPIVPRIQNKNTTCSEVGMYRAILDSIRSGRISNNRLQKVTSHLARYRESLMSGANADQQMVVFRRLLRKFGLPRDTISYVKKPGYSIVGKFITVALQNGNKPSFNHNYHNLTGVYNYYGRPFIIDSAYKARYNINWRHPNKRLNYKLRKMWKNTPWGKANINFKHVYETRKIYARLITTKDL